MINFTIGDPVRILAGSLLFYGDKFTPETQDEVSQQSSEEQSAPHSFTELYEAAVLCDCGTVKFDKKYLMTYDRLHHDEQHLAYHIA